MGKVKASTLSDKEITRLRAEAERLGLRVYAYAPKTAAPVKGRGDRARAIRGRQPTTAIRNSVDLIRDDRRNQ